MILNCLLNVEIHLQGTYQYRTSNPEYINDTAEIIKILKGDKAYVYINGQPVLNKWLLKTDKLVRPYEISRNDLDVSIYGNIPKKTDIFNLLSCKY